jgi:crossover junction endodeoxyribonuclease RuvC
MTNATLGVDPGVSGGLTVLSPDGRVVYCWPLRPSMEEREVSDIIHYAVVTLKKEGGQSVWVEKVGYKKGDGGMGAFTFGAIFGFLRGGLWARGVHVQYVYPQAWQARLGCLTGGNKNVSKAKAAELWPGTKWTHATADSALIAEYGRRMLSRA